MNLVAYLRSSMQEDVGEQDMEEQERGIAEYCKQRGYNLTEVVTDESIQSSTERHGLDHALETTADGIIVTDPLVITDKYEDLDHFFEKLAQHRKKLIVVYENKQFDPLAAANVKADFHEAYPHLLRD
ncbi:MAG: recombinase family protein [Candidatus Obscuribacterales bacterium]